MNVKIWRMWLWMCVMLGSQACSVSTTSFDELRCTPGEDMSGRVCDADGVWVVSEPGPLPMADMPRDLSDPDLPVMCAPSMPMCRPDTCGMNLLGPDGCGAQVTYSCACAPGLVCDEGACREEGACVLETAQRRQQCTDAGIECASLNGMDNCGEPVSIDCEIVCDASASCFAGECCEPRRVDEPALINTVCRTGQNDELCGLNADVDLGCGMTGAIDCQGCSDPMASCEQGVCMVPTCPVGAQCGFISLNRDDRMACGTCSASEICNDYQCAPASSVSSPTPGQPQSLFGYSVALDGDWLAVGAPFTNNGAGAVHLFKRNPLTRVMQYIKTLSSPTSTPNEFFGISVAMDQGWLAVGAPGVFRIGDEELSDDMFVQGNVYMFEEGANNWSAPGASLDKSLLALSDSELGAFGYDVALDEETLLVGAPLRRVPDVGKDEVGGVFVYETSGQGARWASARELGYPMREDFRLGFSVALRGDTAVAGAPERRSRTGALYIWSRDAPDSWSAPRIFRPQMGAQTFFGYGVAVNQTHAYVGQPHKDNDTGEVYGGESGSSTLGKVFDPSGVNQSYNGSSLAVGDRTFVSGAPGFSIFGADVMDMSSVESRVYIRALGNDGVPTTTARALSLVDASQRWTGVGVDVGEELVAIGSPHRTTEAESRVYLLKGF